MLAKYLPLLAVALCWSGCVMHTGTIGPLQYDSRSIERDNSELVHVRLTMGAGDLKVGSGTSKLMQAYFTYNVPEWKPGVDYTKGSLTIRQPETHYAHFGNQKYEWDVRLGRDVPLDMALQFGAGQAQLDLGSLALRDVSIEMGVGLSFAVRGIRDG